MEENTQMSKQNKIIISAVVVLLLLGGYIMLDRRKTERTENLQENNATSTPITTGTTTPNGSNLQVGGNSGSYTIEQVNAGPTRPDLNRPITVSAGAYVSPESKVLAAQKVSEIQAVLKKNPTSFSDWINLAMYQKMGGDYQGALLSLTYASEIAPTDYIALGNIANLYAYFIKNTAQAEIFYKKAIARDGNQVYLYIQLAEVYRDLMQDKTKAKAIIDQGLAKIPNDPALVQFRASLN